MKKGVTDGPTDRKYHSLSCLVAAKIHESHGANSHDMDKNLVNQLSNIVSHIEDPHKLSAALRMSQFMP